MSGLLLVFVGGITGFYIGKRLRGRYRDAIFPDFSGIPDFHNQYCQRKTYNFNQKLEKFGKLLLFQ